MYIPALGSLLARGALFSRYSLILVLPALLDLIITTGMLIGITMHMKRAKREGLKDFS